VSIFKVEKEYAIECLAY